jgi:hypothetical protein
MILEELPRHLHEIVRQLPGAIQYSETLNVPVSDLMRVVKEWIRCWSDTTRTVTSCMPAAFEPGSQRRPAGSCYRISKSSRSKNARLITYRNAMKGTGETVSPGNNGQVPLARSFPCCPNRVSGMDSGESTATCAVRRNPQRQGCARSSARRRFLNRMTLAVDQSQSNSKILLHGPFQIPPTAWA